MPRQMIGKTKTVSDSGAEGWNKCCHYLCERGWKKENWKNINQSQGMIQGT